MPYFTPIPNLNLFYTTHGDPTNPPFLLIHGWTCDSTDWSFTIPALLPSYHIITLDLRGHGHSTAPTGASYTISDFCSDAIALLKHLNYTSNVLVMGHSMGGIVASCLTGLYASIFSGLVVIDPPYWRNAAFWSTMLPKWDTLNDGLAFVTEAFGPQLPPPEKMQPWMFTWYGIRMAAVSDEVVGGALKGAFGQGMLGQEERHAEVVRMRKCKRLAVYMAEENVEKEKGLGMREGDEVLQIGGHGHWLHHVGAEEFNGILLSWLGKLEVK